jgi:GT2 family glycosyltransferase
MEPFSKKTVEIVIPNYNTAELLCRCLDSLRGQQGNLELHVYVVDNASSDNSVERVRQDYPEVHLITSEHNGGFAYAANLALNRILSSQQGKEQCYFVLLLNPDTELPPEALDSLVAFLDDHPEAGVVSPKLVLGNGKMDLACRRAFPTPEVAFYRLVGLSLLFPRSRRFGRYNMTYLDPDETAEVDAVSGAFMLIRGQVVESVGLLDENFFMYGEDLDWAYRMQQAGWKILYYPKVEVRHWKRAASRKRPQASLKAFYEAMRIFYRKHFAPRYPKLVNWLFELGISLREKIALITQSIRQQEDLL